MDIYVEVNVYVDDDTVTECAQEVVDYEFSWDNFADEHPNEFANIEEMKEVLKDAIETQISNYDIARQIVNGGHVDAGEFEDPLVDEIAEHIDDCVDYDVVVTGVLDNLDEDEINRVIKKEELELPLGAIRRVDDGLDWNYKYPVPSRVNRINHATDVALREYKEKYGYADAEYDAMMRYKRQLNEDNGFTSPSMKRRPVSHANRSVGKGFSTPHRSNAVKHKGFTKTSSAPVSKPKKKFALGWGKKKV